MNSTASVVDFAKVRMDFPILNTEVNGHPIAYLDNGSTSQKPTAVIEAVDQFWRTENANVHRGVHHLSQLATRDYDRSRDLVKTLLNARLSSEVIFTKGCTESINLVASCLPLTPKSAIGIWRGIGARDVILVSVMEHHSNIVPWQLMAERIGAVVIPIPITDVGEIDMEAYAGLLQHHPVKVVGIVHVSNSLGTVNPIREMIGIAHDAGAIVLVDGAQAGPHTMIDVQDLDADFYTLSCHKIYAPTGVGVLYGKHGLLEAMPPYQGGGDMIRTVSFEKTTFAGLPAKFEAGTPNIAGVIGLGTAVEYLASIANVVGNSASETRNRAVEETDIRQGLKHAFDAIERHETKLTNYATEKLQEIAGLRITGTAKHKAAIVAFTLDGAHPHDIGTILDQRGIAIRAGHHCCMPLMKRLGVSATARASFAFYNTIEEVDRLADAVVRVKEIFG